MTPDPSPLTPDPFPVSPRPRNWLWIFIGIAFVAVVLIGWLVLWIQVQVDAANQLKPDQLLEARKLWDAKKIRDYQMLYVVQRGGGRDQYYVDVRNGKVMSVLMNGTIELPPEKLEYHSMHALFNFIETFLTQDARPGSPPTFCKGYFDSSDGHLMLFVRRVHGGKESVEIKVEEFRVGVAK